MEETIKKIRDEASRERCMNADEVLACIRSNDIVRATGNLLFHTDSDVFRQKLDRVLEMTEEVCPDSAVAFLTKLAIDLSSFLPEWCLGLSHEQLRDARNQVIQLLGRLEKRLPEQAQAVGAAARRETLGRLAAEAVEDPVEREAEADGLLGDSLVDYVGNMATEIGRSNFLQVARARKAGQTTTEFGNDYAVFLQYVIWLGGSFVTTNPVLIKVAWDTDTELWNRRIDQLILSRYAKTELRQALEGSEAQREAVVETINSVVTMAVVVENCRLLRDIFLVTEGREGNVSLQVNPKMHNDSQRMVAEARSLYGELMRALGGVPNVVFKLPSTAAGLRAAETLTAEGLGVTITLTFSVFQASGFARSLSRGRQLVSYIAIMNGRMAFPARDELVENAVPGGEAASRWAGVEVARKANGHLYRSEAQGGLGVDPTRVKIMIASLRIYGDWIPDISELWGIPLITIFPNVRRAYDAHTRDLQGRSVDQRTPDEAMKILQKGEIFRQAWWIPGDETATCPHRPITLEDRDRTALAAWPPVANTLDQFIDLYEQMGRLVVGRMEHLVKKGDEK